MSNAGDRLKANRVVATALLKSGNGADAQKAVRDRTFELPPWVEAPYNSEPFDIVESIECPPVTPFPGPNWLPIFSFTMPKGWEGVLKHYFHAYSEPGWVPGAGELFFQLQTPSGSARGYDQMNAPRGSFEFGRRIDQFIRIPQGTTVTYNVWVPFGSTLPTGPGVYVSAGISGFYYPVANSFNI